MKTGFKLDFVTNDSACDTESCLVGTDLLEISVVDQALPTVQYGTVRVLLLEED